MITITMPLWIYILTIMLLFLVLIAIFTSIIIGMVIEQKQKKTVEKTYGEETPDGEKIVLTRMDEEKK